MSQTLERQPIADPLLIEAGNLSFEDLYPLIEGRRRRGLDLLVRGEAVERVATLLGGPVVAGRRCLPVRGASSAEGDEGEERGVDAALRAADLVLGAIILVLLAPIMAAIALIVRLTSRGPVYHRARVVGKQGRGFVWRKFRTMRAGADDAPHREAARRFIAGQNGEFRRAGVFKMRTDERITGVGRFLRRHSLDELPQIFDVLAGRMSLVGPRPCLPYEWDLYATHHRGRLAVKPGMTGLWQALGRSRVEFEEMVLLDRCWAWNRSVGLYFVTLVRTVRVVLKGEGGF
jgi:lipopolysaccharide/colanic/teichoic acid biosynthesis glycosyltransferase